jgi:hypothetical protein
MGTLEINNRHAEPGRLIPAEGSEDMVQFTKNEIRWIKRLIEKESDNYQIMQIERDSHYDEKNDRRYQNLKSLTDRLYDALDTDAKRIAITD